MADNSSRRMSIPEGSPYDNQDDIKIEPCYEGYQLIGDSQLLRFSEHILNKGRKKWKKFAYLGLCVSGQRTQDLLYRIRNRFHPSSDKMILMIGTNDLLQNTNHIALRADFQSIVEELMDSKYKKLCNKLIMLTIPPVPRLEKSPEHWETLKMFNKMIKSLHNGKNMIVVDLYPHFIKNDVSPRSSPLISRSSLSSSRSSLVSHSSGISPVQNSGRTLNIPCFTSNFGKIRTNLRIEVERFNDRIDRKVYFTGSDSDSSSDEEENYGHRTRLTASKRNVTSSGFSTPNPKRKSQRSESRDISLDDHNDRFYEDGDSSNGDQFETINREYFEKYFDKECTREDLIHLNRKGLLLIEELVSRHIDR